MPSTNSLLAFTTSRAGSMDDYGGDDGYLRVGAARANNPRESPPERRRASSSIQQMRRMLGSSSISSKLSSARASLPNFRASLPSLPRMPRGRPSSRSMEEPMPSSHHKTNSSSSSSRLGQLLGMRTRMRGHSKQKEDPVESPSPEYHTVDNQRESAAAADFDATLAATLSWIESMDQDDSLCAYALEDLTGSEASRYSSSSAYDNNQEELYRQ